MQITLLVPWLAKCEQEIVYPDGIRFETSEQQGRWVKEWVEKRTNLPCTFDIKFYPGVKFRPMSRNHLDIELMHILFVAHRSP